MILIKILITITVVTVLSVVAERAGPRMAGILAGYPAGSAISLFFIGLEIGPQFAGRSAIYNVAGLAALMCFLLTYYLVSARLRNFNFWFAAAGAGAAAIFIFLLTAYLLFSLHLDPWAGMLPTFLAIPLFHWLFQRISNTTITNRTPLGPRVLLFRAAVSALVVIAVTGTAHLVGPEWAGLLTAFPATIFPLILIVHRTHGPGQAHTVIKNVPLGLWALVIYSLTVSFVYPRFGIYLGTLLAFGTATLYLAGLASYKMLGRRSRRLYFGSSEN
jgi:uncharacterized membrane protein (GlpM family)